LVDVSSLDSNIDPITRAAADAQGIIEELQRYDPALAAKPRWLVLNKMDMVANPTDTQQRLCAQMRWSGPVFTISALSGSGTQALIWALQDFLDGVKQEEQLAQDHADGSYIMQDPRFDTSRSNTTLPDTTF
jgi:GTP-binding protein